MGGLGSVWETEMSRLSGWGEWVEPRWLHDDLRGGDDQTKPERDIMNE